MSSSQDGCGACANGAAFPIPFTMAFQPIVDIREKRIYGYEALVRGLAGESAHSVLSQVTPENRYAFDQSCRVVAIELAARLGLDRRLSINFMPNAVYEPKACIRATLTAAERVNFPLDLISFEILEDERILDVGHLLGIIEEYRSHGFRVALDDFGSGYSGLNALVDLTVDVVKLDMALVRDIDKNARRRAITFGMISVCRELGIDVVAEGVETREELNVLLDAGIRYVQGYLLSRPVLGRFVRDEEIDFSAGSLHGAS